MNHSPIFDEEIYDMFRKRYEDEGETAPVFGPTRQFPEGKLTKADEGEIAFGVAADVPNRKVIINFNSPVAWVGMNPDQAISLGALLIAKAKAIRKGKKA